MFGMSFGDESTTVFLRLFDVYVPVEFMLTSIFSINLPSSINFNSTFLNIILNHVSI